jgi:hypothetical protein
MNIALPEKAIPKATKARVKPAAKKRLRAKTRPRASFDESDWIEAPEMKER